MHERKNMMYNIADGFTRPGRQYARNMEIITWRQLGLHRKPIVVAILWLLGSDVVVISKHH